MPESPHDCNGAEAAKKWAEQLHTDIIGRIVERVLIRKQRGDDYILTATDKWNIETLQKIGYSLESIRKELAEATGKSEAEIDVAMEDVGVRKLVYAEGSALARIMDEE